MDRFFMDRNAQSFYFQNGLKPPECIIDHIAWCFTQKFSLSDSPIKAFDLICKYNASHLKIRWKNYFKGITFPLRCNRTK